MEAELEGCKAWIGRTATAEDVVTTRTALAFRSVFEPFLAKCRDGEAPLALHWCLTSDMVPMADLGPDGHPMKGRLLPPVPLPRRMWAGGELEILQPLRIDDTVVKRSIIAGIDVKEGRHGPICLIAVEHEFSTERGLAIRERQDIAYLGWYSSHERSKRQPSRQEPEAIWSVDATEVLLFRYSALTFNGHRIHYDKDYATRTEGYPGLVVQGPLQASLLINLAAILTGGYVKRFAYRGIEAMIAGLRFSVCGRRVGSKVECWTQDPDGCVKMTAEAT